MVKVVVFEREPSQWNEKKMEDHEAKFKLPINWEYDPQTKCDTSLETENKLFAKEEPFDLVDTATAEMETVPKQCKTHLETGDTSCAKEGPFDADNATAAMETVPKQKVPPLHLYAGNGPRIHRKLCIKYGVVNKRCEDCGQVGQLTCFLPSFRKWALSRVTEEELNQICSRCHERGHNCLNCDIPDEGPVPKARRTYHCSYCGEVGHNQRSCLRAD